MGPVFEVALDCRPTLEKYRLCDTSTAVPNEKNIHHRRYQSVKKALDEFQAVFWLIAVGVVLVVGVYTSFQAVKTWIYPPPTAPIIALPPRPKGLVFLASTGKKPKLTEWYLRADTVMGSRTKRLAWVTINLPDATGKIINHDEWLIATHCETMEMRTLQTTTYKTEGVSATASNTYPFDKAKISYPTPGTGMMAVFKETCKKIYDPDPSNPV